MASQWYYKAFGQDLGPMSFHELVRLARCGELAADDQVRASNEQEWRRADSVVGLFYMARRADAATAIEPEVVPPAVIEPVEPIPPEPTVEPAAEEPPRWLTRLLERVRSGEISPARARRVLGELVAVDQRLSAEATEFLKEVGEGETPAGEPSQGIAQVCGNPRAGTTEGEFARIVEEALAEIDRRLEKDSPKPRSGAVGRVVAGCRFLAADRWLLQQAFRLGGALVAANLAVLWVESWSAREALRFPGLLDKQGMRIFPLIGECQPAEYWFFAVDLMLLVGAAAYLGVRWVENHLE